MKRRLVKSWRHLFRENQALAKEAVANSNLQRHLQNLQNLTLAYGLS